MSEDSFTWGTFHGSLGPARSPIQMGSGQCMAVTCACTNTHTRNKTLITVCHYDENTHAHTNTTDTKCIQQASSSLQWLSSSSSNTLSPQSSLSPRSRRYHRRGCRRLGPPMLVVVTQPLTWHCSGTASGHMKRLSQRESIDAPIPG